jgi:nucleoside-diphosphate-sugar epimerase
MVTINRLAELIMQVAGKSVTINHIDGPLGVRGRNSHNELINERLGWKPTARLVDGLERTYAWISNEVATNRDDKG